MIDRRDLIATEVADFFNWTPNLEGWNGKEYGIDIQLATGDYSAVKGRKPEEIASELAKIADAFCTGELFKTPPRDPVKLQIIFAEERLEKERPPEARRLNA